MNLSKTQSFRSIPNRTPPPGGMLKKKSVSQFTKTSQQLPHLATGSKMDPKSTEIRQKKISTPSVRGGRIRPKAMVWSRVAQVQDPAKERGGGVRGGRTEQYIGERKKIGIDTINHIAFIKKNVQNKTQHYKKLEKETSEALASSPVNVEPNALSAIERGERKPDERQWPNVNCIA